MAQVNEYGAPLGPNGYAPSIVQRDTEVCYLDGLAGGKLDRHECFGGACREKSKRLGLWVSLHHELCHLYGPLAVHTCAETALEVKRAAQRAAMRTYGWDTARFIAEFGKNYLEE